MYNAYHTMDELGGRYFRDPCDGEFESLEEAQAIANSRTAKGQAGYVLREDGAILAPDGTWVN